MKCPHCLVTFHDRHEFEYVGRDADGEFATATMKCPACNRFVLFLVRGEGLYRGNDGRVTHLNNQRAVVVYPKGTARSPVPVDVPDEIADDYRESCLVLSDSPKASAALSRRCLQHVLRRSAGVKPADLANEIQQVLDSGKLPSHLSESIDAVRNIGNFSAHPMKSTSSGEVLPVEPHEAEWNLDVLEALFDFYYTQPAVIAKKRAALNAKLSSAGKPPMKA